MSAAPRTTYGGAVQCFCSSTTMTSIGSVPLLTSAWVVRCGFRMACRCCARSGASCPRKARCTWPIRDTPRTATGPRPTSKGAFAVVRFLVAQGAKAVVVACNTVPGVAVERLRAAFDLPIVAIEPAVKPAVFTTKSGIVGVLATTATLESPNVVRLLHLRRRDDRGGAAVSRSRGFRPAGGPDERRGRRGQSFLVPAPPVSARRWSRLHRLLVQSVNLIYGSASDHPRRVAGSNLEAVRLCSSPV